MQVRVMIPARIAARTILEASARLHASARLTLGVAAMVALATTVLSALHVLPWLTMSAGFGDVAHLEVGMMAQVGMTGLLCLLVMATPSNSRMCALEQSHRDFRVTVTDVANAYHAAHMVDRTSVFVLPSAFDQMRDDLEHLRTHPSLRFLDADILRVAEPPATRERAIIQAVRSGREAGEIGVAFGQPCKDAVGQCHLHDDAESTSLQISA